MDRAYVFLFMVEDCSKGYQNSIFYDTTQNMSESKLIDNVSKPGQHEPVTLETAPRATGSRDKAAVNHATSPTALSNRTYPDGKPRIVALVPMRHHSERVLGKNYRSFAGKELYCHIIKTLINCDLIDEVVIDTDSHRIMEDASEHFPQVRLIQRPEHLKAPTVPMNDVLLYDVTKIESNYYVQTHSTNPLLRAETIDQAIRLFIANCPSYDSLFSVTRIQTRLWDSTARAINHNPAILLRTQDLPPVYEENSCLYIFSRSTLERRHNRIGERPLMFEITAEEAWDIDDALDFRIAEFLYRERTESRG